jgi:hypothetical protein
MDGLKRIKIGKEFKLLCPKCIKEQEDKERERRELAKKKREEKIEKPVIPTIPAAPSIDMDLLLSKLETIASSIVTRSDFEGFASKMEGLISSSSRPGNDVTMIPSLCVNSVMQMFMYSSISGTIATFEDGRKWGAVNKTKFMNIVFNLWMQGVLLKNKRCRFVIDPRITDGQLSRLMGKDVSGNEYTMLMRRSSERVREATKGYEYIAYGTLEKKRKENYAETYKDVETVVEITSILDR